MNNLCIYVCIGDVDFKCWIAPPVRKFFLDNVITCTKPQGIRVCLDVVCHIHSQVIFQDKDFYHRQEPKYTSYGLIREIYNIGSFKYFREKKKIVAECMIPPEYILNPVEVIVDTIIQFMHLSMIDYDMLPIHASVVHKSKKGVVVFGNSGAGKSTMQIVLIQKGYSFFSDDGAFVDCHMRLHANMIKHISYTSQTAKVLNDAFNLELDVTKTQKERIYMQLQNKKIDMYILIFPEKNMDNDNYEIKKIRSKDVLSRLMEYHVSNEYSIETKVAYWKMFTEVSKRCIAYAFKWSCQFDVRKFMEANEELIKIIQGIRKQ